MASDTYSAFRQARKALQEFADSVRWYVTTLAEDPEWFHREIEPELDRYVAVDAGAIGDLLDEAEDGFADLLGELVDMQKQARIDAVLDEADRQAREIHPLPDLFVDGFDPRGAYVYLLWGDDPQTPLYVGMSVNVLARVGSHVGSTKKAPFITRVTLVKCESQADACVKEMALIRTYQPPWNRAGVEDIRHHPAA